MHNIKLYKWAVELAKEKYPQYDWCAYHGESSLYVEWQGYSKPQLKNIFCLRAAKDGFSHETHFVIMLGNDFKSKEELGEKYLYSAIKYCHCEILAMEQRNSEIKNDEKN